MNIDLNRVTLAIVIVLYKKSYSQSIAIKSILGQLEKLNQIGISATVHVWNNTPDCSEPLVNTNVVWHLGKNDGLAYIYNKIALIAFGSGASFLMVSDDDTDYTDSSLVNYMSEVTGVFREYPEKDSGVFLPCLFSNGQLISPGKRIHFMGRLLPYIKSGFTPSKNLLAINSGITFTKKCYEKMNPFYDTRLMFYCTDTDFFIRYENFFSYVYVLDITLNHDLSEHTADSPDRALYRFSEMVKGYRLMFSNKSLIFRALMEIYLLISAARKSKKYKTLRFFSAYNCIINRL